MTPFQVFKKLVSKPVLMASKLLVILMVFAAGTASAEDKLLDIKDGEVLKSWFKEHEGKPRLILFLSPT